MPPQTSATKPILFFRRTIVDCVRSRFCFIPHPIRKLKSRRDNKPSSVSSFYINAKTAMVIYLAQNLHFASSGLPTAWNVCSDRKRRYLTLLRMRLALSVFCYQKTGELLPRRFTLTRKNGRFAFCCACCGKRRTVCQKHRVCADCPRLLAGILSGGARTFLCLFAYRYANKQRPYLFCTITVLNVTTRQNPFL